MQVNATIENIGARRLHTVIERIMDEVSFTADEHAHTVCLSVSFSPSLSLSHSHTLSLPLSLLSVSVCMIFLAHLIDLHANLN